MMEGGLTKVIAGGQWDCSSCLLIPVAWRSIAACCVEGKAGSYRFRLLWACVAWEQQLLCIVVYRPSPESHLVFLGVIIRPIHCVFCFARDGMCYDSLTRNVYHSRILSLCSVVNLHRDISKYQPFPGSNASCTVTTSPFNPPVVL